MSQEPGNQRTVFVVFADHRKDFSKAEEFGQLRDVFSSVGRNYNASALIEHARHVLGQSQPGDYLLVVGDPTLVGICMVVMAELDGRMNLLRWDRDDFRYSPLSLDFQYEEDT